ncbi:MAG: hypothetical protein ACQEWG_12315 [Bacteroidota bacterium]
MELHKLESLLKRYDDGETTLEEEKLLKKYFHSEQVPNHLKEYKVIFNFSEEEKNILYPGKIKLKSGTKWYAIGIAASILLAAGIFTFYENEQQNFSQNELGTIENPEEAYYRAKETLQMVAQIMNTGKEELVYLDEFNKTKNQIIKIK